MQKQWLSNGDNKNNKMANNTSINSKRHPYMRLEKWRDGTLPHFWESDLFTEKGKQYCRDWLNRWEKESSKPVMEVYK